MGCVAAVPVQAGFTAFESGQVRPLALSPDGQRLFAVNTPDNRLEILAVTADGLTPLASVPVGLEPVAVAARTDGEVWVVNHLSDSISIVDVAASPPHVARTLLVGDEPRDLVFAGAARGRAFVTTAHRGQNRPGDPQLTTPGIGRADVWVFAAADPGAPLGGTPLTIVTLFTDTPRALAVSPDGATVYAAGFHTGNRTTALHDGLVCDGGAGAGPCTVSGHVMPGGLPPPNTNAAGVPQPEVGLIVRHDGTAWRDQLGRNWNPAVRFSLPDKDVFAIDALASPPAETGFVRSVGAILYAMVVHPLTGALFVANTDANNAVRFEGPGGFGGSTVRGHLHEARISIVAPGGGLSHRHLNKHLDYDHVPTPEDDRARSLATPAALAITADGGTLYVAAFGSGKVGVFDTAALAADTFTPDTADQIAVSGGGPSGLVLDEARQRLFVLTRFDDAISVVDTAARREVAHVALHDPEPASIRNGRRFLYDAAYTSSNGEASCSACHVFGDLDSLAWDLGNPDGAVLRNENPLHAGLQASPDFHPMKGPMVTQSLRGMANHGPLHWRGDRTGGLDAPSLPPDGGAFDERVGFLKFNAAFAGLLGRADGLSAAEMFAFGEFLLQVRYPPNPIRALDNSLTPEQAAGRSFYFDARPSDVSGACNFCHVLDPARGVFGTDGHSIVEPQGAFKIPHLRNLYQKVGMFGMPHVPDDGRGFGFTAGDHLDMGEQVRGVGFTHDGSVDTVRRFLRRAGFNRTTGNPGGFALGAPGEAQRAQVQAFLLAYDTDLAPIVGQQVSATTAGWDDPSVAARVDLLLARAAAGECDVVAHAVAGGVARGWLYDVGAAGFRSDRAADAPLDGGGLRAVAARAGQDVTFTSVPPGSGRRIGIDRDEDGYGDRDELDAGSDPLRAASTPRDFDPVVAVRGATLSLRDDVAPPIDASARRVRFRTVRGRAAAGDVLVAPWDGAGDPTRDGVDGGAVLRVYNGAGGTDAVTVVLPAAHWRRLGSRARPRGYRYRDPAGDAGPISKVLVARAGLVALAGGGGAWRYTLDEPRQGTVGVRLQLGRGDVWCAAFHARPGGRGGNDRPGRFEGARGPVVAAACPALP